jgi:very-short-patch-repair endonuclease
LGIGFRRQHAIGPYVVDFCAPSVNLIVEVDGSQHLDFSDYEIDRAQFLSANGYRILRFWNNEITNDIQSVIVKIIQTIQNNL